MRVVILKTDGAFTISALFFFKNVFDCQISFYNFKIIKRLWNFENDVFSSTMISQGVPCNLEYSFCDFEKISVGAISQRQRRDSGLCSTNH